MEQKRAAQNIVDAVGIENINSISHCATRIRIVPKNAEKIQKLEEDEVIKGTFFAKNQFQVFISLSDMEEVFQEVNKLMDSNTEN